MTHKSLKYALCFALAISITTTPAYAIIPVIDATNLAENILSAARALQSNINEAQMIYNQMRQLQNEARNLASLPTSIQNSLNGSMQDLQNVLRNTQGLVYNYKALQSQFDRLYPDFKAFNGMSGNDYSRQVDAWSNQTMQAIQDAMRAQGLVVNTAQDGADLNALVSASQSASGNLSALQAGNQISALMVKQLVQLQQIVSASSRAQASYLAQQTSADAAAKQRAQHYMDGWGKRTRMGPARGFQ